MNPERELHNMSNSFMLTGEAQLHVAIGEMIMMVKHGNADDTFQFYALRCVFRMFRTLIFLVNGIENFSVIHDYHLRIKEVFDTIPPRHLYFLSLKDMFSELENHMREKELIYNVRQSKVVDEYVISDNTDTDTDSECDGDSVVVESSL